MVLSADAEIMRWPCLPDGRSEEHTSELQSDQISYAVFCLKKKLRRGGGGGGAPGAAADWARARRRGRRGGPRAGDVPPSAPPAAAVAAPSFFFLKTGRPRSHPLFPSAPLSR